MIKLYLFDIEGTTTDINFVHKVLFPYAAERIENFVKENSNNPIIANAIEAVKKTVLEEEKKNIQLNEVIEKLLYWIKTDRKHGVLKEIQGLIWDHGYANKDFQGHVYSDVEPFFSYLKEHHALIGIYSSGSVHAQKLIFGNSLVGDLTPYISYYFDTKIGGKREKSSYLEISKSVGLAPNEIHFFSDIPEELEAAASAGFKVTQLLRDNNLSSKFDHIKSFEQFKI
ncbi:MAG: acireductone synthase [Bacteriovoracaceae bacterium]